MSQTMPEALPYGLRDVKLTPITNGGTLGTPVDLPNSQTLSFEESEEFSTLRGDDKVVASRGSGAEVSWELESGGISLEAYAVMNGGTVTVTGVGPSQIRKYTKKATDSRPEFKAEGQAMSESGGDFHMVLHRAKATESLSGELSDGEFFVTSASGTAIAKRTTEELYDLVQNQTVTPIPTT